MKFEVTLKDYVSNDYICRSNMNIQTIFHALRLNDCETSGLNSIHVYKTILLKSKLIFK